MPIGRQVVATAKTVNRAFNHALADAGGSVPTWLILTTLRRDRWRTQQDLARAVGIEGPTPPSTRRATGGPDGCAPSQRCAAIRRSVTRRGTTRGTQRILLFRPSAGGDISG